jgi:hypothetical protein
MVLVTACREHLRRAEIAATDPYFVSNVARS